MALSNIARQEVCTDPDNESQINQLLEKEIFSGYMDKFCSQYRQFNNENPVFGRGETTHVSVIDKDMNAASVTTTNGEGCGYILPGTGIMLNNMLGEEDLNPQGFHNWSHSRRLPTMISPSIITQNGKPMMIIGSGGSNRIRSAMVQVLINYIYKKLTLQESIEDSRIHLEGDGLYYEPGIDISENDLLGHLSLHPFEEKNLFFGGVNAVTLSDGFSDPRRGGAFEIV
jgi:gamma-glutamyltranspeptidase/glutathione hydrolase